MDIVFVLGTCLNLAILIAILFVYRKVRNAVTYFISAPDTETPSPLAQTTDAAARVFIGRAVEMLGMHDKAQGSANVRRENAVETAMVTDILSGSSPLGAILATQFPHLTKKLAKNPALLQYAMPMLQKMSQSGGGNGQTKQHAPLDLNIKL